MRFSPSRLLLLAVPPVAASFAVLAIADASASVWMIQAGAVILAGAVAAAGAHLSRLARNRVDPAVAVMVFTLAGLAAPLLSQASGPVRWVSLGPVTLYVAPVVLPAFLVTFSALVGHRDRRRWIAFTGAVGAGVLLAMQPDASQVLALLVAVSVAVVRVRANASAAGVSVVLLALATARAFWRPDPLEPVPHVEGVFLLAIEHSMLAGTAILASAAALVAGLHVYSFRGHSGLSAVAGYYAVLFACSGAGLTPAPLIGYGAGPLLGFGLMVAMSWWVGREAPSELVGVVRQPHQCG